MAKSIVTGGAGFIGSNLVDELIKRGDEVIVIDNLLAGKEENINKEAFFYKEDIRDFVKIAPLFKGVDYVFHLAALPRVQPSIDNPLLYHDVNVNGTLNVLEASRMAGVKKYIFSSTCALYGDKDQMPLHEGMSVDSMSPYSVHKHTGEEYAKLYNRLYGLETVSLRYFNIYGKRQPIEGPYSLVVGIFVRQKLNNEYMTITGTGENKRDYTSVDDAVRANILASESGNVGRGEVINIGSGKNISVNEIAIIMGGPTKNIEARIEPREILADIVLAKELLEWEPIVEFSDWILEYKKELGLQD